MGKGIHPREGQMKRGRVESRKEGERLLQNLEIGCTWLSGSGKGLETKVKESSEKQEDYQNSREFGG